MNDDKNLNITWQQSLITGGDREALLSQVPRTLWFTGLSGSGKTTLAFALEYRLFVRGNHCFVLDGDNIRHGLSNNLGFSAADRSENIRRIAEVAKLMNDAGLIVICAFISPYAADRELARDIVGAKRFEEIYISTPLTACESRDPKGLYSRARSGQLPNFTGVSAPYESPRSARLEIDTSVMSLEAALEALEDISLADT